MGYGLEISCLKLSDFFFAKSCTSMKISLVCVCTSMLCNNGASIWRRCSCLMNCVRQQRVQPLQMQSLNFINAFPLLELERVHAFVLLIDTDDPGRGTASCCSSSWTL